MTITVKAIPTVDAGPDQSVCLNLPEFTLTGTPAGGIWSGDGVTAGKFNPATAGVGDHVLTYTVTGMNGCTNSDTMTITVKAIPTVDAGPDQSVCLNLPEFTLTGTPAGGIWSGDGVTAGKFNPATAGVGDHVLTYTVTGENECTNSDTMTITVKAESDCTITAPTSVCAGSTGNKASVADAGESATYTWLVTGGTITGGHGTNEITWSAAAAGTATISVSVTNSNGCSCSSSAQIEIEAGPTALAGDDKAVCAADQSR